MHVDRFFDKKTITKLIKAKQFLKIIVDRFQLPINVEMSKTVLFLVFYI